MNSLSIRAASNSYRTILPVVELNFYGSRKSMFERKRGLAVTRKVWVAGALSLLLGVSLGLVMDGSLTLAAYAQNQNGNNQDRNSQGGNYVRRVPEPGTLVLFGAGVDARGGGLILRRRNHRK
jgi:hypothetical protein